jgi:hypothetical protein
MARVHPCRASEDSPTTGYMIRCPACGNGHLFNTAPGDNGVGGKKPVWDFNGDLDAPTFSPSMLCQTTRFTAKGRADYEAWYAAGHPKRDEPFESEPLVCHSYVRNGQIEFLGDCTHEMAGKTVPLEDW